MKLLLIGLFPVIIFWFVEDKFGTLWGLIAAVIWAIGECIYEYATKRRIDNLTLFSTGLVVILGGVGAWLDKSVIFKFQPVIVEIIFAIILIWGGRKGGPLLLKMAKQSRPDIFNNQNEVFMQKQRELMSRLSRNLIIVLILHALLLSYVAITGTTGQWAFWKGIGFNLFVVFWMAGEFILIRSKAKKN